MKPRQKKASLMSEFTQPVIEKIKQTLLENGYEMGDVIGRGGYSLIYKVHSVKYDQFFAAKIVNAKSERHSNCAISIENEIYALTHLYHPNIIKLYSNYKCDDFHILILELCTPFSLHQVIKNYNCKKNDQIDDKNGEKNDQQEINKNPHIKPEENLTNESSSTSPPFKNERTIKYRMNVLRELISAVQFCHLNGIAHRDIKPHNVLFDNCGHVKLADFGCSRLFDKNELSTELLGSPHYMSPEIYNKAKHDPFASDIWSLGVTFYELCGGIPDWPSSKDLLADSIKNGGLLVKKCLSPRIE
ncbi:AGC family protein kinase [Tritrichomonas foetus]|uniref:AGC family protein kinase n=1 Tax=Tritrichomonas foetus TaxID=1144522 RepID=A0A1J4KCK5_9EUKA|nr:AGC family protein kinase [Tritrichomonas foetus]|eukprot:OHT08947.1 AGC family protein kinase [Tritrichomonas foetus]